MYLLKHERYNEYINWTLHNKEMSVTTLK